MKLAPMLAAPLALAAAGALAEPSEFRAQSTYLDAEIDGKLELERWEVTDEKTPYEATVSVAPGQSRKVCVLSGANRRCAKLKSGSREEWTVVANGKRYPFALVAIPPAANFTPAHVQQFDGQITFTDPPVYELVNIAIALTPTAHASQWLTHPGTYRDQALAYFDPVKDHAFVQAIDAKMRASPYPYFFLKMSAYAYEMDGGGRIRLGDTYTSTNFEDYPNALAALEREMQSFAADSGFDTFYRAHKPWYGLLEKQFGERMDVPAMDAWLRKNFPAVKPYNHVNVVFSPLVYGSQSTTRMESNGFREAQLHMNFPYLSDADQRLSAEGQRLQLGMLTFTELNHNYINPTADLHAKAIAEALAAYPREKGATTRMYADRLSYFNEMMNWGLIGLLAADTLKPEDAASIQQKVSDTMGSGRGFTQFPEFAAFLVPLYTGRPNGSTLADLYPQIIAWFAAHPPKAEPSS